jgi:hypothetical protein
MTAAAHIVTGDVLDDTYEVDFASVRLSVRRSGQRVEFAVKDVPGRIGVVRFGGPASGALWINGECVGEYERDANEYVVTPITEGRRQIDSVVRVHPVDFLLTHLTAD